jgi:hypothetical protein
VFCNVRSFKLRVPEPDQTTSEPTSCIVTVKPAGTAPEVGVTVGVGVGVAAGSVSLGVGVGVGVEAGSVSLGVGVGVGVEAVSVSLGVGVGVGVEAGSVSLGVGVGVGVEAGSVSLGVGVGVGVTDDSVSLGVGVGVGVGEIIPQEVQYPFAFNQILASFPVAKVWFTETYSAISINDGSVKNFDLKNPTPAIGPSGLGWSIVGTE